MTAPAGFGQRASAQRRIRRTAARRLLCNTNGCATLLTLDFDAGIASCPICGSRRPLRDQTR